MDEQAITKAILNVVQGMTAENNKENGHVCKCGKHKMTLKKAKALAEIIESKAKEMGVNVIIAVAD